MKTYTLPDEATIIERMKAVDNVESDILAVVQHFAKQNANKALVAAGINLAWELAIHDVSKREGAMPMLSLMMSFQFDEYMSALITDDEVLQQVLDWRRNLEDATGLR